MIDKVLPEAVDAQTAPQDFWARYHAYRRLRLAETRPEDPVKPDDLVEIEMKRDDPFGIEYRYEMASGRTGGSRTKLLSWFYASTAKPGSPGYETSKHIMWVNVSVHPDHRRRGVGRAWIELVLELMDRHGCTTLSMGTEEVSGHAFLKWMGAEAKFSGAENRLELSAVDWAMVKRWVEEGPKVSPTSKLEVYDGPLPREMWEDYCPQLTAMLNTMPWEQMDHGEIVVTPAQLAEWYVRMDLEGTTEYTMLTREPNGIISGITDLQYAPYRPTMIHQGFTGVRTEARGRGLGKWLKAAMLLHVRLIYPELDWVVTENAGSNAPMLAINRALGFKEYRAGTEYQMSRDQVVGRLQGVATRS